MDAKLKHIKKLYDLGFSILWLKSKSKAPVENSWTSGNRKDWQELIKTFKPSYNIGVRLGTTSEIKVFDEVTNKKESYYLAVIDCDVKSSNPLHQKEMNEKLKEIAPLKAPTVMSGRGLGSCHIYIRTVKPVKPASFAKSKDIVKVQMPSAVKVSKREQETLTEDEIKRGVRLRPAWEISIMGDGQQTVLPPSIHPDSGKKYEWVIELEKVSDIPLRDFMQTVHNYAKDIDAKQDVVFKSVDLISSELSDKALQMITDGAGVEDRSAALLYASKAMAAAGFADDDILSVLTDKKFYLGAVAYDHTKSNSRKRAADWVRKHTLKKAKNSMSAEKIFEAEALIEPLELSDNEAEKQDEELKPKALWTTRIQRSFKDGQPKNNLFNVKLVLDNFHDTPIVVRDSFKAEDAWLDDMPWGSQKGSMLSDDDTALIKNWFTQHWRFEPSTDKIENALTVLAVNNQRHPVREYLQTLVWDKKPRLKTWLTDYLGASYQPAKYLEAVGTKTLLAMVARIYEPGIKYDNVLILEGAQNIGKSSTARILAGEWFNDTEINIGDKDAIIGMQGIWVYELGELSALSRYDTNRLKQFISSSVDKIRPPFGKRLVAYPRQCIFIGTTNNDEYLKDRTGNRRYYPVKCEKLDMEKLKADRDQLLAEASFLYKMGEDLWVKDEKLLKLIQHEQGLRVEHDEIEDQLEEFLNNPVEAFPANEFRICDIMKYSGDVVAGLKNDRQTQMRLGQALRAIGYNKQQKRVGGVKGVFWRKSNSSEMSTPLSIVG